MRLLGLDESRVNVNGGQLLWVHPISASGGVILTKLLYELRRTGKELGLATMCLGGGQGVALVVRNEVDIVYSLSGDPCSGGTAQLGTRCRLSLLGRHKGLP